MDVEELYSTVRNKNGEIFSNDSFDVNVTDIDGNTLLHFAAISNDIETSKQLMNQGAIYNIKNKEGKTPLHVANGNEIKNLFKNVRMFFKAVKTGNFNEVSKYIMHEKFLVNVKEENSGTALHWAVSKNNNEIVKLLLESDSDVLQLTDKGNTALHTAVFTGNEEIVESLLKNVSKEKLFEFVNFQTYKTKSTCLHFSAEDGYFEIVMLLLKHGAIYNIQNTRGLIPCNLTKNPAVKTFLELIRKLFSYAKNGDSKILSKLKHMQFSELEAAMNVQDTCKRTIVQVLEFNGHDDLASEILKTFNQESVPILPWKFDELEILERYAKDHLYFSDLCMPILKAYSNRDSSEKIPQPWKILKEGSYYIGNAYRLVSVYKSIRPGPIKDKNIKRIDSTLYQLQFHPSHISTTVTIEEYGEIPPHFISKANGTEYYYKLLHDGSKKDLHSFIELVKKNIDTPVEFFLADITEKCLHFPTEQLNTAIENNNESEVLKCIEKGADINYINDEGETPLILAVKCGFLNILKILLENGADVQHILPDGNTALHIAISNRPNLIDKKPNSPLELTKCLLRYGAIYNYKNERGRTPLDESRIKELTSSLTSLDATIFRNMTIFFRQIDACFLNAENDDPEMVEKLQFMTKDEFEAVTQSRNEDGCTLLQLAVSRGHKNIERTILQALQLSKNSVKLTDYFFEVKMDTMKNLAINFMYFSEKCLLFMEICADDRRSRINSCTSDTLREGSHYLHYAYNLVHVFKNTLPYFSESKNIEKINCTLNQLQFDPSHISECSSDKSSREQSFISKAEGTELYYRLLTSKYKRDIRQFLNITEQNIHIPAKLFLEEDVAIFPMILTTMTELQEGCTIL